MSDQGTAGQGIGEKILSDIVLKGMTWQHPRGYDPLVACSRLWKERTGVSVEWVQRSLQDFESYPVEDLAREYDLIIIDHPHVGQVADENCLLPLDAPERRAENESLARASVGPSYESYHWKGRQWALPVDAAAAVLAYRPDILQEPPKLWTDVIDLARRGMVMVPLRPPHNLMVFFTLAGNLGKPCSTEPWHDLIDMETGEAVYQMMQDLASLVPAACFDMDPIAVYEAMGAAGSTVACAPMQMAYSSYSRPGFRPCLVRFANIPVAGVDGPMGSALGGTGLAVSSFSKHPEEAAEFAYWVASSEIQRGIYVQSGGQAGHADAWIDEAANAAVADFYRSTRATYEAGWLRPRHNGYMQFQQAASERINAGLKRNEPAKPVIGDLNAMFRKSF